MSLFGSPMFGRFLFSFEGRFSASLSAPYGFLDALLILQRNCSFQTALQVKSDLFLLYFVCQG